MKTNNPYRTKVKKLIPEQIAILRSDLEKLQDRSSKDRFDIELWSNGFYSSIGVIHPKRIVIMTMLLNWFDYEEDYNSIRFPPSYSDKDIKAFEKEFKQTNDKYFNNTPLHKKYEQYFVERAYQNLLGEYANYFRGEDARKSKREIKYFAEYEIIKHFIDFHLSNRETLIAIKKDIQAKTNQYHRLKDKPIKWTEYKATFTNNLSSDLEKASTSKDISRLKAIATKAVSIAFP